VQEALATAEAALKVVNLQDACLSAIDRPREILLRAMGFVPDVSEDADEAKPPIVAQQPDDTEKLQFAKKPQQTTASSAKTTAKRRQKGEATVVLVAALCQWHGYSEGGCDRTEPIGVNELARRCRMRPSTVSSFFLRCFQGYARYRQLCNKPGELCFSLKLLRGEVLPRHFVQHHNDLPSDDQDNDD